MSSQRQAQLRVKLPENLKQNQLELSCNYPIGAVIMVAGAGGGMTGPAAMYPELSQELSSYPNIIAIQMDYRYPGDLKPCVEDTIETLDILTSRYKVQRAILIGWSFGGAVVISAGSMRDVVRGIATVASQTAGTDSVSHLGQQGKACLFIHGKGDQCLSYRCSEQLYRAAGHPKELVLFDNDNHGVTQHKYEAKNKIKEFVLGLLTKPVI